MKGSDPVDSFCYEKAKEGQRFLANNTSVQEIPEEELATVKKITLVKQGDQLCISYNKVIFGCKKIPNSTTEQNAKLLSFQNNYIAELQKYLKNDYSLLYYQSDLPQYFSFYSDAKKEIKSWNFTVSRKWTEIPITNVASLYPIQYNQSAQEYLTSKVVEQLPSSLLSYYQQEREKWYQSLLEI